jgi:hypothetical protein
MGCVPVQLPVERLNLDPCCAVPERIGAALFAGAVPLLAMTGLGPESTVDEPPVFVAVTRTRSVWPTSAEVTVLLFAVAPGILAHPPSPARHRSHWYRKLIGSAPLHSPGETVSTLPSRAVPEIVGGDVFTGALAPTTTCVRSETAEPEPAEFLAVTLTRIVCPTSASTRV